MAVLEGMGCGLPVLIADADTSATSQFFVGPKFLFPAGSVPLLQERIDYLIEHPDELKIAGGEYQAKSRQFGFDGALQQLETLLAKLVENSCLLPQNGDPAGSVRLGLEAI